MGKYWISSPIVLVDHGTGKVIGRVVAKRKRAGVWNIICHSRGREIYLLCLKVKEHSSFPWYRVLDSILAAAEKKIGKVDAELRPIERRVYNLPEKGFKLLDLEHGELGSQTS